MTFDLAATTDTAKRGSETDTLTGVEGAIGSSAADVFKGNEFNNYFQGGNGKDTFSGGSGRDLYDFNAVAESGVGTTKRDVISDFDHLVDDIDLMGIDANTTVAGNQAFRWVELRPLRVPASLATSHRAPRRSSTAATMPMPPTSFRSSSMASRR